MRNISALLGACAGAVVCPSWCDWNITTCSEPVCYGGYEASCPTRWTAGENTDVDTLTDEEIRSKCLTVAQCRYPPAIDTVRDFDTKNIWKPSFGDFSAADVSSMNVHVSSNNYRTRTKVKIISNTFYPRGSTASNATIVRVDFLVKKKRVYMYIDMTCGAAAGYFMRGGFMGRGYFKEVLYKTPGMNIHNGLRAVDVGFTDNRSDYGDPVLNRRLSYFMVFQGLAYKRRYTSGVTLNQTWLVVDPVSAQDAIPAHLDAAVGWAGLLPPYGNLPVAAMYVHEARRLLTTVTNGTYSYRTAEAYGGSLFEDVRPAVRFLLEQNLSSATACRASLPGAFVRLNPPEQGCIIKMIDCATWRNSACDEFGRLMRAAKEIIRPRAAVSIPRCIDCPGLIGTFRNGIPPENPLRAKGLLKIPQCLPSKLPNSEMLTDHNLLYY